jgi:peptidoglycan/LPS O-acetylase OafA/YrhL
LLGVWFVAVQQVHALNSWVAREWEWPFYVVAAGALILVVGLLTGAPAMAIPACIVAGIGGTLYYQLRFNDWDTWKFLWTLLPGFVGSGTILTGLFGEDTRHNLARGANLLALSAVMFMISAAFFKRLTILGPYGVPALLMLLGLYVIVRGVIRSRGSGRGQNAAG